ncbi:MAG: ABC transporter ATP-binding protein, partial [Candidatus Hadarchaeales archaeon]
MKAVEIRNLRYTYPDGTRALRGVNLEVEEGESVFLMGPNGSGKSTLLLHLNGLLLPQSGEVKIFGLDPRNGVGEIRRRVGLVFQDPDDQLFMPTVFEDVAFGPLHLGLGEKEVRRRVKKALE